MPSSWVKKSLVAAYLTAFAFLLAHAVNAGIEHVLLSGSPVETGAPPSGTGAVSRHSDDGADPQSPEAMTQVILASGLFYLPSVSTARSSDAEQALPPLNLAAKLKLRGTALGAGERAFAVIEEISSKRQVLYHLGEQIPDAGELVELQKTGVLIRQGGSQEFLPVTLQEDPHGQPVAVATPAVGRGPGQVRKTLDRREVEAAVSDMTTLLASARALPFFQDGKIAGFRVDVLNPDSFYGRIGVQSGDILKRVNGIELKDPGQVLNLFQQVRQERTVKLDMVRAGQPTSFVYEIR